MGHQEYQRKEVQNPLVIILAHHQTTTGGACAPRPYPKLPSRHAVRSVPDERDKTMQQFMIQSSFRGGFVIRTRGKVIRHSFFLTRT